MDLYALQLATVQALGDIERILGPNYKPSLLCRFVGSPKLDADIYLSRDDDTAMVIETIAKMVGRPPAVAPKSA